VSASDNRQFIGKVPPTEEGDTVDDMVRLTNYIIPNIHNVNKILRDGKETWIDKLVKQIDYDTTEGMEFSRLFILISDPNTKEVKIASFPYSIKNGPDIKALIKASA